VTVAAVVAAAGAGTRFTGAEHKLAVPFRGKPLLLWAVDAALDAGLDEVFVVTGATAFDDERVTVVHNERWPEGIATSLQVGMAAAAAAGHDAVVVGLGDQPLVPASAWRAVAAAAADAPIVTAVFAGRRSPPVRLARSVWPLLPTTGDEGARALMRERPDLVVEVACEGEPTDVDTLEDLREWS
jgi:CTP:molybdopterin cytidylyltransferase MocA